MKRFFEKLVEGSLLISGSITSITILLIVIFLFKEASGLFNTPVVEEGYVLALNKENKVKEEIKVSSFTKLTKIFTDPLTENKYEDYEAASWYKRFASFFLDTIVVVPIYLLFIFIIEKFEMKDLNEAFMISSIFLSSSFNFVSLAPLTATII